MQARPLSIARSVAAFLAARCAPGDGVVAAFSGGTDSTALLLALTEVKDDLELRLVAAHLDHAADDGSASRAAAAAGLAAAIGVPFVGERLPGPPQGRQGLEAAAREARHDFLERVRRAGGAPWIATGHHRDDQLETVLMRLLQGSGWAGLGAIAAERGPWLRPLLPHGRDELAAAVAGRGLRPVDDPGNRDLARPRNLVRHLLVPRLTAAERTACLRLAAAARGARGRVDDLLARRLRIGGAIGAPVADRAALASLPEPLLAPALALLHRRAGRPHPPHGTVVAELARQLRRPGPIGVDAGGGWQWASLRDGKISLARARPEAVAAFAYTVEVPGEKELPAIGQRLRLDREPVAAWMWRGEENRAALCLPLNEGDRVTIRNRRPGDRIHPLGGPGERRLKDVLIDRRVPRERRDLIPLLCVGDVVAWVPGVTVHHRFRLLPDTTSAWVASLESA